MSGRAVRITAILMCIFLPGLLLADEIEFRTTYTVGDFKVKEPGGQTYTLASGKIDAGLAKGKSCGDIANLMATLGMNLDEESLKKLFDQWGDIALPAALYFLATATPIAKEVIVGARTLSQFVAQLGSMSCEGIMNAIDKLNLSDSTIVKKCMEKIVGGSNFDNIPDKKLREARDYCIEHGSLSGLAEVLGLDGVTEFITYIDPRSYAMCLLQNSGVNLLDPNTASYHSVINANVLTKAASIAVLLLPTADMAGSLDSGHISFYTIKLDGEYLTLSQFVNKYIKSLKDDLQELLNYISSHQSNTDGITDAITQFSSKYGIEGNITSLAYLISLWGSKYPQPNLLNPKVQECYSKYRVAEEYFAKNFAYLAVKALHSALREQGNKIINAAEMSAATSSKYLCNGKNYSINKDTVDLLKNNLDAALDFLRDKENELGRSASEACEKIAEGLSQCLGNPESGFIEVPSQNGTLKFYFVGNDCSVIETEIGGLPPSSIPTEYPPGEKYNTPEGKPFKVAKKDFIVLAYLLVIVSLVYFARHTALALTREQWKEAIIHGSVILLIVSMMIYYMTH